MERSKILDIVSRVMEELNQDRDPESRLELSEDTLLFGRDSSLDSLGLVNLILGIEQTVLDELGVEITLAEVICAAWRERRRQPVHRSHSW